MPIENIMYRVVKCDAPGCGRCAVPAEDDGDAQNNADEAGWSQDGDHWYCVECTKARAGLKPEPKGLSHPQQQVLTMLRANNYFALLRELQKELGTRPNTIRSLLGRSLIMRSDQHGQEGYLLNVKGLRVLKAYEETLPV